MFFRVWFRVTRFVFFIVPQRSGSNDSTLSHTKTMVPWAVRRRFFTPVLSAIVSRSSCFSRVLFSGSRDASGATQDREATLNQLLSEMDGFEGKDGIVVMASTNRKVRSCVRWFIANHRGRPASSQSLHAMHSPFFALGGVPWKGVLTSSRSTREHTESARPVRCTRTLCHCLDTRPPPAHCLVRAARGQRSGGRCGLLTVMSTISYVRGSICITIGRVSPLLPASQLYVLVLVFALPTVRRR